MKRDLLATIAALTLHGALAFAITKAPNNPRSRTQTVDVEIHRIAPPPLALPPPQPPPPPPPPPKRVVHRSKTPPAPEKAPIPNREPPKEPPKQPPPVRFGVTEQSTVNSDSSIAVPVGNSTIADPKNVAKKGEPVQPLAPAPPAAAPAPVWKPASPLDVAREPDWDEASCSPPYPDGEAKQLQIEGETLLRVDLDEHGKVHGTPRVLRGVGHGLDTFAVQVLKTKCRFGPAISKAGKPVPYTITYSFRWVLDR